MALHLVRVWGAYKDIRIHSSHTHARTQKHIHRHAHTHTHTHMHTHTHTQNTCINTHTSYKYMHYRWWVGRKKKTNDRSICRREEVSAAGHSRLSSYLQHLSSSGDTSMQHETATTKSEGWGGGGAFKDYFGGKARRAVRIWISF